MGSRAENSKLLIMAGSFQWLAPSRSPPRVTSLEQKTLLSSRRWQGFQEFYPGTGSRDWYTFSITSTYTLHWDTQSLSKGIQLTDSFKRIKFNHQHPHISFFFFFLRPHLLLMDVPRLGVELELQLQPVPQSQQCWIWAPSVNYAAACSHAGSLTHWMRPGIEPASLQGQHWVLNLLSHNGNSAYMLNVSLASKVPVG